MVFYRWTKRIVKRLLFDLWSTFILLRLTFMIKRPLFTLPEIKKKVFFFRTRIYYEIVKHYTFKNGKSTLLLDRPSFLIISHCNRYRRKRPTVDASIFDSAWLILVARTRRKKEKKIACPILDVFACGQVSSPRLYRITSSQKDYKIQEKKFFPS